MALHGLAPHSGARFSTAPLGVAGRDKARQARPGRRGMAKHGEVRSEPLWLPFGLHCRWLHAVDRMPIAEAVKDIRVLGFWRSRSGIARSGGARRSKARQARRGPRGPRSMTWHVQIRPGTIGRGTAGVDRRGKAAQGGAKLGEVPRLWNS